MPVPPGRDTKAPTTDWLQLSAADVRADTDVTPQTFVDQAPPSDQDSATLARGQTPPTRQTLPQLNGYEVMEELGRGGMGVVYKAKQLGLNRLTAVKMILAGPHAEASDVARFRAEAEAVAQLQHPHIVQVYEIGDIDGVPFFSLEYLPGGSLQDRLGGQPQPPREAAALLETLARAMQVAHDKGIVHRDLKPANVLLSFSRAPEAREMDSPEHPLDSTARASGARLNEAVPKITDFGLAKRLAVNSGHTRTGEIVGTPSYMAPEQAAGLTLDIGPATDIYALGAILYEMLTGRPPFKGLTPMETVLQVLQEEPVSPARLMPTLPADLETICLKCLRKEPQQRYSSALALAEDLRRFQNGEPIAARPLGRLARTWRWCRRNPAVAGLLTAVVFSLAAGSVVSTYFAVQSGHRADDAERERERANREAAEVLQEKQRADANFARARQAVKEYLTQVTQEPRLQEADFYTLRKNLLSTALPLYQELSAQAHNDAALGVDRAEAFRLLAFIQQTIGDLPAATNSYRQYLALARTQEASRGKELNFHGERGMAHVNLGKLLYQQGKLQEAETILREGLALATQTAKDFPNDVVGPHDVARCQSQLGLVQNDLGQHAAAEKTLRQALVSFQEVARRFPENLLVLQETSGMQADLGTFLTRQGRHAEAEQEYLAARRFWEAEGKRLSQGTTFKIELSRLSYQLAKLYAHQGRWQDAEREYKTNLQATEQLVREFPTVSSYRIHLGLSRCGYALFFMDQNRFKEAEEPLVQARQLLEPLAPPDGPDLHARQELGRTYFLLAHVYAATGRTAEGEKQYQQAQKVWKGLADRFPTNTEYRHDLASAHLQLGNLYFQIGRLDDAEQEYRHCLTLLEKLVASESGNVNHRVQLGGCLCNLANVFLRNNQPEEALSWYDRAVTTLEEVRRKDSKRLTARHFLRNVQCGRAVALLQTERFLEALDATDQALALDDGRNRGLILMQRGEAVQQILKQWQKHLQSGATPEALMLAERLVKLEPLSAEQAFQAARLCAQTLEKERTGSAADRFAALAFTFLTKARTAGHFQKKENLDTLQTAPDFAPLRARPEWEAWKKELPTKPS